VILQSTQYTCGPASVVNALLALGDDSGTERDLDTATGCDPIKGTQANGLKRGLKVWGDRSRPSTYKSRSAAWRGLLSAIRAGDPCVVVVEQGEHWATVIGLLGNRVLVADSGKGELVLSYSREEFLDHWLGHDKRYYMIRVSEIL
jgi:ABC-type bacteriocin/lantibiotic exporter with double-glycine peptidase domain